MDFVHIYTFQIGGNVIVKQTKSNKLTPAFNPTPLRITEVQGSRITAQEINGSWTVMRDASYFRKIKTDMIADNEDDEDASGESDGTTENENADTGALQKEKEKQQETPDENIEENLPLLNKWVIEELLEWVIERHFNMEGNIERCFDSKPPFQLGETILTGSFSEGLFLFLKESPDLDFMCVLKNNTFTQEDQEHGGLSFSENTPFVNAFVINKEAQSLWDDFCDDADEHAEKIDYLQTN